MNPILLLFTLLILAVFCCLFRPRREECHNAKSPAESPQDPPAEKAAENPESWAQAEIDAQKAAEAPKGISEAEIIEKVRVGLTRDQAIEVIKTQRDHDAQLAKDAKKK